MPSFKSTLARSISLTITLIIVAAVGLFVHSRPAVADTCSADLVVNGFVLTDAAGNVKTTFATTDKIYPRVILANQGNATATSPTGYTTTTFYRNSPGIALLNQPSDTSTSLKNGQFTAGLSKTYAAYPGGVNNNFYQGSPFWQMSTAGSYVARVVINSDGLACQSNAANDQLSTSYTITATGTVSSSFTRTAADSTSGLASSTSIGWKNSAFMADRDMVVTSLGIYGLAGAKYEFRQSDAHGTLGNVLVTGTLGSTSSAGYYTSGMTQALNAGNYYVFRVYQATGTSYALSHIQPQQDMQFLGRSSDSATVSQSNGVYLIRVGYTVSRVKLAFDQAKFTSYGFPAPQYPNPIVISGATLQRFNDYMMAQAIKAQDVTGVDAGLIAGWALRENSFDSYMDNCDDSEFNPNSYCYYWGGDWQVGYGNHVDTGLDFLLQAIQTMHPGQYTPQVGQAVLDASAWRYSPVLDASRQITIPSTTFPNYQASQIISGARDGNETMRTLAATLMKDDGIGAYLIARNFKDYIGLNGNLAWTMQNWGSYYNRQTVINAIKAVYDAGLYR